MYIGASLIEKVEDLENGNKKVLLADGSMEYVTPEQLEAIQSEEAYPDGQISMRKWKPTISAILEVLLKANMQMNDKDWVMQRVDESIVENFKSAVAKKFGVSTMSNISLQDIDSVLK